MRTSSSGKSVEYDGLIDKLIEYVIPNHFGVDMYDDARSRILDVSKIYSKSKGVEKDWVEDSKEKDARATVKIRKASEFFLSKSYMELHEYNMA